MSITPRSFGNYPVSVILFSTMEQRDYVIKIQIPANVRFLSRIPIIPLRGYQSKESNLNLMSAGEEFVFGPSKKQNKNI